MEPENTDLCRERQHVIPDVYAKGYINVIETLKMDFEHIETAIIVPPIQPQCSPLEQSIQWTKRSMYE